MSQNPTIAKEPDATGEHLGKLPQAFIHLGLIKAAMDLDRSLDLSEQRMD